MNILELSEQEIVRRNNLQTLRDMGIEPYPAAEYPVTAWSADIVASFVDLPVIGKDEEGNDVPAVFSGTGKGMEYAGEGDGQGAADRQ